MQEGEPCPPDLATGHPPVKGRLTVGVLSAETDDRYQNGIFTGILAAAQDYDVNLIHFVGQILTYIEPRYESIAGRNSIFELVNATQRLDGLLLFSAAFASTAAFGEFERLCARYGRRPAISIGLEFSSGAPRVMVDNASGLREVIDHLIDVHGCRRLAFVCGPELNPEAQLRYQVYGEALAAHGIPLRPEMVLPGHFTSHDGEKAIATLLDERQEAVDAVVAADDETALGVLEALRQRGLRAPDHVRVTGFDDVPAAYTTMPPLTTVRQPLYQVGYQALSLLVAQVQGESLPEETRLAAQPVYRRSCGCEPVTDLPRMPTDRLGQEIPFEVTVAAQRAQTLQAMVQAVEPATGQLTHNWAEQLLDTLVADLRSEPQERFLPAFGQIVQQVLPWQSAELWEKLVTVLQQRVLQAATDSPAMWARATDLWQSMLAMLARCIVRQADIAKEQTRVSMDQAGAMSEEMILCRDLSSLSRTLAEWIPRQGVERYGLCLYVSPQDGLETARLVIARGGSASGPVEPENRHFAAADLWPSDLWPDTGERYHVQISPLYFQDTQLGYMVFDLGRIRSDHIELANTCQKWTAQISHTLQSIKREAELQAAKDAAEVANRAKNTFLSVMGHELRTPLHGIFLTAELLREQDHSHAEQVHLGDLILSSGRRLLHMVEGVMEYTALDTPQRSPVDVGLALRDNAVRFEARAARRGLTLSFDTEAPLPTLFADPVQFDRILQRLLDNAVKFTPAGGRIQVTARSLPRWPFAGGAQPGLEIAVLNSGPALAAGDYSRMFDPFVQLEASHLEHVEGAGLGLTLARRQAEAHGGTLCAEYSPEGQGHLFTLRLPLC